MHGPSGALHWRLRPTASAPVIARLAAQEWCDTQLKPARVCTDFAAAPSLKYLQDGRLLMTEWPAWYGGRTEVWDPSAGTLLQSVRRLAQPDDGMYRAPRNLDPWGKLLVYHLDAGVVVHDLRLDRPVCRLAGIGPIDSHANTVWPVLSADGKRVLVSGPKRKEGLIRWFDSKTGAELGRYRIPQQKLCPGCVAEWYSDNGTVFGYGMPDGRLALFDCLRGEVSRVIGIADSLAGAKQELAISPWTYHRKTSDALILASRGEVPGRREFAVWDRPTGKLLRRFLLPPDGMDDTYWWNAVLSPDGRFMACAQRGGNALTVLETASARPRGRLQALNEIHYFAFAQDGGTLATSADDGSVLIWDLNRPLGDRPPLAVGNTAAEHDKLWTQLGDPDPAAAEPALWALVRAPQHALPLLRERLKAVSAPDPKRLHALIAQLDSDSFEVRDRAARELTVLADLAQSALRAAQQEPASLEQRRRIEQLLAPLDAAGVPPCLRELRAVEALHRMRTAEARQLLQTLAGGTTDALLTREAHLALQRW